jgi:hypothetical protein
MGLDKVRGVNFGNPEMYNMEEVLHRVAGAGKVYYGAIPMKVEDGYEAYFSRLCAAATDSAGCCRLLLVMNASDPGQAEEIRTAWRAVNP